MVAEASAHDQLLSESGDGEETAIDVARKK